MGYAVMKVEYRFGRCIEGKGRRRLARDRRMRESDHVAAVGLIVTLLGLLLVTAADAETMTVSKYRHPDTAKELEFNRAYFTGVKDGLLAYNASSEEKAFCPTGNPPLLTFDQANDAMMLWVRKNASRGEDTALERALLLGLKERYPCQGNPR